MPVIVSTETLEAIQRFAARLAQEVRAQLEFYGLPTSFALLVFTPAWREAVAHERPYHQKAYTLVQACIYGTYLLSRTEVWAWDIVPRDVGRAEEQTLALGLPILSDVMLDVPNPEVTP